MKSGSTTRLDDASGDRQKLHVAIGRSRKVGTNAIKRRPVIPGTLRVRDVPRIRTKDVGQRAHDGDVVSIQQSRASYPRESQARAPSVRRLHSIVCADG